LVERSSGAPRYAVAVRPLSAAAEDAASAAAVLLFIHDPANRETSNAALLASAFRLTEAEADVANALCVGLSPNEYACEKGVSPNTVYTHIRNLKEKTGSRRMAELLRKLHDAQAVIVAKRLRGPM
jgi:DNA-binding CsgD family transcriptional regulator